MPFMRVLYALALAFTLAELRSAECRQACIDRPRDGYTGGRYEAPECVCTKGYPYDEATHKLKKPMQLNPQPVPTVNAQDFYTPSPAFPTEDF